MKIRNAILTACIAGIFWILASFVDIDMKNPSARDYAPWNVFAMAAGTAAPKYAKRKPI